MPTVNEVAAENIQKSIEENIKLAEYTSRQDLPVTVKIQNDRLQLDFQKYWTGANADGVKNTLGLGIDNHRFANEFPPRMGHIVQQLENLGHTATVRNREENTTISFPLTAENGNDVADDLQALLARVADIWQQIKNFNAGKGLHTGRVTERTESSRER